MLLSGFSNVTKTWKRGTKSAYMAINVCTAILYSCSFLNPLLYYWRIKEIRDSVRSIARKFFCKQNQEES